VTPDLWWPLLLCAAWLVVVAIGVPSPTITLALPCVLAPILTGVRGPFSRALVPALLRAGSVLVPTIVVAVLNPWYDRFGLNQGRPGVITPSEFWSHIARVEIIALVLVELTMLALASRTRVE
jgi:hypothetical protein